MASKRRSSTGAVRKRGKPQAKKTRINQPHAREDVRLVHSFISELSVMVPGGPSLSEVMVTKGSTSMVISKGKWYWIACDGDVQLGNSVPLPAVVTDIHSGSGGLDPTGADLEVTLAWGDERYQHHWYMGPRMTVESADTIQSAVEGRMRDHLLVSYYRDVEDIFLPRGMRHHLFAKLQYELVPDLEDEASEGDGGADQTEEMPGKNSLPLESKMLQSRIRELEERLAIYERSDGTVHGSLAGKTQVGTQSSGTQESVEDHDMEDSRDHDGISANDPDVESASDAEIEGDDGDLMETSSNASSVTLR